MRGATIASGYTTTCLRRVSLAIAVTVGAAGCEPTDQKIGFDPKPAAPLKDPQWTQAIEALYEMKPIRSSRNAEGVKIYDSCFTNIEGPCFRTSQDAFQKTRVYRSPETGSIDSPASLRNWIFLSQESVPSIHLTISLLQERRIGANEIAILADGKVIFTRTFDPDRDIRSAGSSFIESPYIKLADDELAPLSSLDSFREVIIRISGERGYVTVAPKETALFISSIKHTAGAYRALLKASTAT